MSFPGFPGKIKFWSQKDAEGVDIQKTFTGGELTTDDSLADGVAVVQSTTEAPTSKFSMSPMNDPYTIIDTIFLI